MRATTSAPDRSGEEGGRISVVERVLPEPIDPIAFLEAFDDERSFYCERADDGVAIAAAGVVADAGLAAGAVEEHLRVGGFAFDRSRVPAGPWTGFPRAEWASPRLALVRRAEICSLRAAATDAEGGEARAAADLEAALRLIERPMRPVAPRAHVAYRIEPLGSVESWRRAVEETLEDIRDGRLSKAVLARAVRIRAASPWQRWTIARRLRAAHPESTVFVVGRGRKTFVGATPERLARVEGERLATAAVAGTAPPGSGVAEADDVFLRDEKERHEHAFVVEEIRRRLGPLASQLEIPDRPSVLATAELRHLHTPIAARLRDGASLVDVCARLHPTPAVCGLPCDAAMAAVRTREDVDRGWYAGGVGWVDAGGGEVVVPLRSALLDGAEAVLYAGAGIVSGSRWDSELEETRLKMRVMQAALVEL